MITAQKAKLSIKDFFQETADLVIFSEEIPNGEVLVFVQSMVMITELRIFK